MDQPISIIDLDRAPTPDELYRAALFIEDAAAVADVLADASMTDRLRDSAFRFLSTSLSFAGEILTLGLSSDSGTFSNLAKTQKVS